MPSSAYRMVLRLALSGGALGICAQLALSPSGAFPALGARLRILLREGDNPLHLVALASLATLLGLALVPARSSPFLVRCAAGIFVGIWLPSALALAVGVPLAPMMSWLLTVSTLVAVLESGGLRRERCPDTSVRAFPWQMSRCASRRSLCRGRKVLARSLVDGICRLCSEEREVRLHRQQPPRPAPGARCARSWALDHPGDPVTFCPCGTYTFSQSEMKAGHCPMTGCVFSEERALERARLLRGDSD